MKFLIVLLALVSFTAHADDVINVDLTGYFLDPGQPNDPWDVLFTYDMTTGVVSNLFVENSPDCFGTNAQVTSLTSLNGQYLDMSGTKTVAGCQTIAFSGAVNLDGGPGPVFGGAMASYEQPTAQLLEAVQPTSVPEPGSLPLMLLGFAGLFAVRRKA
jgi:PEP-CTERM motif